MSAICLLSVTKWLTLSVSWWLYLALMSGVWMMSRFIPVTVTGVCPLEKKGQHFYQRLLRQIVISITVLNIKKIYYRCFNTESNIRKLYFKVLIFEHFFCCFLFYLFMYFDKSNTRFAEIFPSIGFCNTWVITNCFVKWRISTVQRTCRCSTLALSCLWWGPLHIQTADLSGVGPYLYSQTQTHSHSHSGKRGFGK